MGSHFEGWVGIPHGGIGMGAVTDLALTLADESLLRPEEIAFGFPFAADFRLGGSSARIGDTAHLDVHLSDGFIKGTVQVTRDGLQLNSFPYITALIRPRINEVPDRNYFTPFIEAFAAHQNRLTPLPSYKNCFVCGIERRYPGLMRRFGFLDCEEGKFVFSLIGLEEGDGDAFYQFKRNGYIHPLPFIALIDEILGWAGFMLSASGGVTVRISYSFYRAVQAGEKIVVFGRGHRIRGSSSSRLMFWASGGAFVVRGRGDFEPVAVSSGQYMGVADLTEQMKTNLRPEKLTRELFRIIEKPF
jgi:hypothetical protein